MCVTGLRSRDVHYTEDYKTRKLQIFPKMLPLIFDVTVGIDNAIEDLQPLAGADTKPRVECELSKKGGAGLWCKKTMRYKGLLSCSEVDYRNFPFDQQALPLRIKAKGSNRKGTKLGDPKLRIRQAQLPGSSDAHRYGHKVEEDRIHLGELHFRGFGVRRYADETMKEKIRNDTYEVMVIMERIM